VVAIGFSDDLFVGLILGCFVGLVAGPLLRAWLVRGEWIRASREADQFGHDLDRIEDPGAVASAPVRRRAEPREA
jgi:hypothetical protein